MSKTTKLVIGCHHILEAGKNKKKIKMFKVLKDTFACSECIKNEPKNKEEFMDMFVTICEDCIKGICKN